MKTTSVPHYIFLQRRLCLAVAAFLCAALCFSPYALAAPAAVKTPAKPAAKTPGAPQPVVTDPFPEVVQKAIKRAGRSYKNDKGVVADFWQTLSAAQWTGIRFKPERALWGNADRPLAFAVHHPGFIYTRSVTVNVVSPGKTATLPFSPDMFAYGNRYIEDKARQTPPGFAGLAATYPLNSPYVRETVASFLGATYFQGVGRHSQPGLNARALALNTALADGEEFPHFTEFWIMEPEKNAAGTTVCALMESPSLTGAFRFVIIPGTSTVMDVESRLFLRKNASWPQKIGIAPLNSMFLHAETENGAPGDYRPEVHNSDGLLFSTGENAWTWRPLANPSRLAVTTFPMENPRGFGLMQRDNSFDHYQDVDKRFERKPSAWIEPQGDWGPGRVELIEIPSSEDFHDNIVAFWVPDSITADDSQKTPSALSLAYKIYWMTPGVTPHALGRATATRIIKSGDSARFIIDFESEKLKALPSDTGLTSLIETPDNAPIMEKKLVKNPATGGWRLFFSVRLPRQDGVVQSILSARDGSPRLRFRALLKKGENLPDPLTEEWVYDFPL